jgi:hypothetical protein
LVLPLFSQQLLSGKNPNAKIQPNVYTNKQINVSIFFFKKEAKKKKHGKIAICMWRADLKLDFTKMMNKLMGENEISF